MGYVCIVPVEPFQPFEPFVIPHKRAGYFPPGIFHQERHPFGQGNSLPIESMIFAIKIFQGQPGGQQGVDEIEVIIVMGHELIFHFPIQIGSGQGGENCKGGEVELQSTTELP